MTEYDGDYIDFEFERKFYVEPGTSFPSAATALILQGYLFISHSCSVRTRLSTDVENLELYSNIKTHEMSTRQFSQLLEDAFTTATGTLTIKESGRGLAGIRYEKELYLSTEMVHNLLIDIHSLDPKRIVSKVRHSFLMRAKQNTWAWEVDQFLGLNTPLIVAECENSEPLIDLTIPTFCTCEVTDDPRFTNAYLAEHPYTYWSQAWRNEIPFISDRFSEDFGTNNFL